METIQGRRHASMEKSKDGRQMVMVGTGGVRGWSSDWVWGTCQNFLVVFLLTVLGQKSVFQWSLYPGSWLKALYSLRLP